MHVDDEVFGSGILSFFWFWFRLLFLFCVVFCSMPFIHSVNPANNPKSQKSIQKTHCMVYPLYYVCGKREKSILFSCPVVVNVVVRFLLLLFSFWLRLTIVYTVLDWNWNSSSCQLSTSTIFIFSFVFQYFSVSFIFFMIQIHSFSVEKVRCYEL